jgi:hypothetical protein
MLNNLNVKWLDAGRGHLDGEAEVLNEDDLLIVLAGAALITALAGGCTLLLSLLLLLGQDGHNHVLTYVLMGLRQNIGSLNSYQIRT